MGMDPAQQGDGIVPVAGKHQMTDDDAPRHQGKPPSRKLRLGACVLLEHRRPCLNGHLGDGCGGSFKVVSRPGKLPCQAAVKVLKVRQPDIHVILQGLDNRDALIAAAVVGPPIFALEANMISSR